MLNKNNKIKISGTTWDEGFELPHESYSITDIKIILSTSSRSMKHSMISHQSKYLSEKSEELHSRLNLGTIFSS